MTYFGFLGIFLLLPLGVLFILNGVDRRAGRGLPVILATWSANGAVLLHVVIAVAYTTLWDNYLVATGVWYYKPEGVTGVVFGYVPLEEYTFFILQSLLTGYWLIFLAKRIRLPAGEIQPRRWLRVGSIAVMGVVVIAGIITLASGWKPGTYAALILVWSLPPVMIQVGWGGHILWKYRRLVFTALGTATIYLAAADWMAINSGIWTIDPRQSLNVFILGALPVEEFIFFLMTNTLLVFGITLALAQPSLDQFRRLRLRLKRSRGNPADASSS